MQSECRERRIGSARRVRRPAGGVCAQHRLQTSWARSCAEQSSGLFNLVRWQVGSARTPEGRKRVRLTGSRAQVHPSCSASGFIRPRHEIGQLPPISHPPPGLSPPERPPRSGTAHIPARLDPSRAGRHRYDTTSSPFFLGRRGYLGRNRQRGRGPRWHRQPHSTAPR